MGRQLAVQRPVPVVADVTSSRRRVLSGGNLLANVVLFITRIHFP